MAKKTATKMAKPKSDGITNIIITGVGGQGALSLATVMAEAAMASGQEVRMSELHGLAKRFGHLECHIRFGKTVRSSIVPNGEADLVIALEPLEALVMYKYMDRDRTAVIMDTKKIKPTKMDIERIRYPEIGVIVKTLKTTAKNVEVVDASEIAKKAVGSTVYANIYLLGRAMKKKLIKLDKGKMMAAVKMLPSPDVNESVLKLALK
ncbi:Indolepyruvate oxidoreductase subunit IorB [uncultured archaeon]|nr:Indolepyruvate oxidoreductase subunit IorB [uncultured archaeon]